MRKEYVFYPSKGRMILLFIGNLAFLGAGMLFILIALVEDDWLFGLIGTVTLLFFGMTMMYFLYRFVKGEPSLIITDDYLYDNGSMIGVGRLDWEEVESIFILSMKGQKFLGIEVVDRDALLQRLGTGKQMAIKLNRKLGFPTVNLPQTTLKIPLEDLLDIIVEKLNRYEMRKERAKGGN